MSFQPFAISSPSKVILHGEHSVVYGKTAVAVSVGLRLRVTVRRHPTGGVTLDLPAMSFKRHWTNLGITSLLKARSNLNWSEPQPADDLIQAIREFVHSDELTAQQEMALVSFLYLYSAILGEAIPMCVRIDSCVPFGAGMGSSAAYAVALSAAMLHVGGHCQGDNLPRDLISRWAFCSEGIVHGTPSGIDNSTCTMGGAVSFRAGKAEPLGSKIPALKVLLVDTGVSRSTKRLVELVREKRGRHPQVVDAVLDAMDAVAKSALEELRSLKMGDANQFHFLEELVDLNQSLLATLGVSHPSLDRIVSVAASHGFHAKLTGAGGGGLAFVLLAPGAEPATAKLLKDELESEGFRTWQTELGVDGVRVEDLDMGRA